MLGARAAGLARLALLALLATACSAQLGGGWATRQPDGAPRVLRLGGQLEGGRDPGATLNARATLEIGNEERPVVLRNVAVGAGGQGRALSHEPFVFGLEGGVELGVGEPSYVDFESPGAYLGARLAMLFRLYGDADFEPNQYYLLGVLVDLVPEGTAGAWTAPEGSADPATLFEAVGQLALRVTILSDLTRSPPRVEPPEPKQSDQAGAASDATSAAEATHEPRRIARAPSPRGRP